MVAAQIARDAWIERLEVEGGFLDGVDLTFVRGLNTIIGARGTGKTSIIELIRFCLDALAMTDLTATRAREHALAVLGDGRAVVTVAVGDERIRVARSALDETPDYASTLVPKPLIFAQNEIEVVAADEGGRRRLLDAFAKDGHVAEEERAILVNVAASTAQLRSVAEEVDALLEQARSLSDVDRELKEAEAEQQRLLATAVATEADQARAEALDNELSALRVRSGVFERLRSTTAEWAKQVVAARANEPTLEPWPQAAGASDPLDVIQESFETAGAALDSAASALKVSTDHLTRLLEEARAAEARIADDARELRSRLEAAAGGAGAAARRVADRRQRAAQEASLRERIAGTRRRLEEMQKQRLTLLDELDRLRGARYESRLRAAELLTSKLSPEISVQVERLGSFDAYAAAIASALRGSQIHYNVVAPLLAKSMSPRELVEAVEAGHADQIAQLANIDQDRAARIVSFLRGRGGEEILSAELEDVVHLCLLDGGAYKRTLELSTGQRCTVVLSVLLQHEDRIIVVDQPEDHLDNAFVANTLVRAILGRDVSGQLIVSTHNPNIPVLGEASQVIVLESDGSSGHVESAEPLDAPVSIKAITELMEGGLEALQKRARFYESATGA